MGRPLGNGNGESYTLSDRVSDRTSTIFTPYLHTSVPPVTEVRETLRLSHEQESSLLIE